AGASIAGRDWPRLRRLSLQRPITERFAEDLSGADGLRALRRLDLCSDRDSALSRVLSARWFGGVRHLDGVARRSIRDVQGRQLGQLRTLGISSMKEPDFARLADSLPSLTALSLPDCHALDVAALAESPLAARLRHLGLSGIHGDGGFGTFALPAFAAL